MDIYNNMEIENFELVIGNISEGVESNIEPMMITEEMVKKAVERQIIDNRSLNNGFELAVYDMVRDDLLPYVNENIRGK